MSASCIMFAYYLTHDEIFHPLCLWREKVCYLQGSKFLSLYIADDIIHAIMLLNGESGAVSNDSKHLVEEES